MKCQDHVNYSKECPACRRAKQDHDRKVANEDLKRRLRMGKPQ